MVTRPVPTIILAALFLLSGLSALILEIVWTRRLELLLGNTVQAATTMIAIYMLGLGLGARLASKRASTLASPLKAYALLEAAIILWALAVPFLLQWHHAVFPALTDPEAPGTPMPLRLLASLSVFIVPTLLMGATLPVLTDAVARAQPSFARRFSLLYGANTLGAAAGAFSAGFLLLPTLGLMRTTLVALALNGIAAAGALVLQRNVSLRSPDLREVADNRPPPAQAKPQALALMLMAAVAGFLALYLEVFWFRSLILVFGSTTYSFSAMLTIFLTAAALGPLILGWLGDVVRSPANIAALVAGCLLLAGVLVMRSLYTIAALPESFLTNLADGGFTWRQLIMSKFLISMRILFLPALLISAVLPLIAKMLRAHGGSASAAGRAYLANTLGAVLGVCVAGFAALPAVGLHDGLLIAACSSVVAAMAMIILFARSSGFRFVVPIAAILLLIIWIAAPPRWDYKKFALGAWFAPTSHSSADAVRFDDVLATSTLLDYEEGITATVAVLRGHDDALYYLADGKVEADTSRRAMINQRLIGHLPVLLHPGTPQSALNIGLGAGVTVGAIATHSEVTSIHSVEIERAAVMAARAFALKNHDVLNDPKVTLVFNDARNFLSAGRRRFDLICADPFEPVVAGAIHLFTREHYALAKSRLNADGVLCQWIPMYEMALDDYTALVATFTAVFPNSLYFSTGADSILIGFNGDHQPDLRKMNERLRQSAVSASLEEIGFREPAHLWSLLIADFHEHPLENAARLVTDDDPFVEFSAPKNALNQTYRPNRKLQIELFEAENQVPSSPSSPSSSSFIDGFPEAERRAIQQQRQAVADSLKAGLFLAEGRLDPALQAMERALTSAPGNPLVLDEAATVFLAAANVSLSQGEEQAAIAYLARARDSQPDRFQPLYKLAAAHLRSGDRAGALPLLQEGVKRFPNSPWFHTLLSNYHIGDGDLQSALASLRKAVSKAPGLDSLWSHYERLARASGDPEVLRRWKDERQRLGETN